MMEAPCRNCNHREIGCHAVCESYISFRVTKDKENEEINKKRDVECQLVRLSIARKRRAQE